MLVYSISFTYMSNAVMCAYVRLYERFMCVYVHLCAFMCGI
jgi:hypothetical protein